MPGAIDTPWRDTHPFGVAWDADDFDAGRAWHGLHRAFESAAATHPGEVCERHLAFAGRAVRLRVVGRTLFAQLVRPFEHLAEASSTGAAALAIDVWDDTLAHHLPAPEREGDVTLWREMTVQSADDRFVAQRLPHTMSCLDRRGSHLVAGIAWHDRIFIYERAKPFARALLNWYNDRDVQVIHAGLVAHGGQGVLLAGRSGSGKSTSTLACALGGLAFLGEDYVALESRGDGRFVGHSVYNSVFLDSTHLRRFDGLAAHAVHGRPPQEAKSVVLLAQVAPDAMAREATIRALVFPRVGEGAEAALAPMSRPEALLALAPSSLLQIPNRQLGRAGFGRLAQLVERLPCYRMSVGEDLASIPRCLAPLLSPEAACAH